MPTELLLKALSIESDIIVMFLTVSKFPNNVCSHLITVNS